MTLLEAASSAPHAPGVYRFSDASGDVLYVGKARDLRARLAWYRPGPLLPPRTAAMLSEAVSVEWTVVDTEVSALLLEATLIRTLAPRFNVRLKDDSSYPELVLTAAGDLPSRLMLSRRDPPPGSRRFGPYPHARAARRALEGLLDVVPVRSCSDRVYRRAERSGRPCLLADVGRCAAPCVGRVDAGAHAALASDAAAFLSGSDTAPVLDALRRRMIAESEAERFESAARTRDRLAAAERLQEGRAVVDPGGADEDVFSVVADELTAAVTLLRVRAGAAVGTRSQLFERSDDTDPDGILTLAVLGWYRSDPRPDLPRRVVLPPGSTAVPALRGALRAAGIAVAVASAGNGRRRALVAMAEDNASDALRRDSLRRASDLSARSAAAVDLAAHLALASPPLRVECFDVSHLGGTRVVASQVVAVDGLLRPDLYRSFRLRRDANDDVAAMREVISRRLAAGPPPDLLVVDGGAPQLGAALEAAAAASVPLAVVGLAKRLEEVHVPGSDVPVRIPFDSEALHLLRRLRDEAHRRAVGHQRRLRRSPLTVSALDGVPGLGPARRAELLRRFGDVDAVLAASDAELLAVPGVGRATLAGLRRLQEGRR